MRGLLDTSVVVALSQINDVSKLPEEPVISAITLAELSVGPLAAQDPIEISNRQVLLQQVEADFVPIPFDAACARAFGQVAASLRARGRKVTARTYDALIAATAVAHNLPLYTTNPNDFDGLAGLVVREVLV